MVRRSITQSQRSLPTDDSSERPKGILERLSSGLAEVAARQSRLETILSEIRDGLGSQAIIKEYYTTAETAAVLGKATFTVRQWARLRRINAEKTHAGRGLDAEWRISHAEIKRIQNEGLLPIPERY